MALSDIGRTQYNKGVELIFRIKGYFSNKKISYILYVLSTSVLFLPSIVLLFSGHQSFKNYIEFIISYVVIPSYSIAVTIDIWTVIRGLWKTTFGKVSYSILGYFALTYAHALAKNAIYYVTNENPDFYQTSIEFLSAIYLIPSWIIFVNSIIAIVFVVGITVITPFMFFNFDKITRIVNKFFKLLKVNIIIQKHDIFHIIFTLIASIVFISNSMSIMPYLNKIFDDIFISKAILNYSYYPNRVCGNINHNQYIMLIGEDKVSKSNINSEEYALLSFNTNNKKIIFETVACIRSK
jgi:hypothetical protein